MVVKAVHPLHYHLSMSRVRRQTTDVMIGAGSLGAVVVGMSMVNASVRTTVANVIAGDAGGDLSALAFNVQSYSHEWMRMVSDYRAANGPMVAFGVVAVCLAVLMFKT
jgi:predicted SpoU family rRNA methylase